MITKEFKHVNVRDLIPYDNNPRNNKEAVKYVVESINQCENIDPIEVDEDNVILSGHTRRLALIKLKIKETDVIVVSGLTEEQKRKYRILANKTNEFAEWDMNKLTEELEGLDFEGFDFEFGDLLEDDEREEVEEDDYQGELPEEPKAKFGQIYKLGNHRLMCGDATSRRDVERLINGTRIDFVNCDPPYGMNAVTKSGVLKEKYGGDIMNDDDNKVAIDSFNLCQEMFGDAKQVWWGANYYTECLPSSECWIVWDKANGGSDQTDCELAWANFRSVVRQFTMASEKKNRVHPTQKPCKLLHQIINKFDKEKKFHNIVDLFGGSGFTLITCEQLGKRCFTMELDPKFVDVIIDRWEKFTGMKAELVEE